MVGLDKIYVNSYKEFKEFYGWCVKYKEECLKETEMNLLHSFYFIPNDIEESKGYYSENLAVTNTNRTIDRWLYLHCPIDTIREHVEYIESDYGKKIKKQIKIYM